MEDEYKLTYFNYRGLAEPIRLIFKLAEVPFEDIRLEWDDEWEETHKQKYPWGSLPVLHVGDFTLGQSVSISRFLANKFGLTGKDEFDAAKCDEMVQAMTDLREEWTKVFMEFNPDKKTALNFKFLVSMCDSFEKCSYILQMNGGKCFVGESITWADIYVAYFIDFFKVNLDSPDILADYPDLQKFQDDIFAIPQLKEWIAVRPMTDF